MKYTLEQLQKLADKGKLTELDEIIFNLQDIPRCGCGDPDCSLAIELYTTTTNKEQVWDLMIKYELSIWTLGSITYTVTKEVEQGGNIMALVEVRHKDPLVAVTIAAILVAQEDNEN